MHYNIFQTNFQISPGSIGERAGLQLDDMIIKINGEDVSELRMIRNVIWISHWKRRETLPDQA